MEETRLKAAAEALVSCYPEPVDVTQQGPVSLGNSLRLAIDSLEPSSSPGALWSGGTNSRLLEMRFEEIVDAVTLLYCFLCENDITGWSSERIFRETGIAYKVFIKDELHPLDKADNNRWRIIFSNPIILNILERMVFGPTLDREKKGLAYFDIATTIGLVMSGPDKKAEALRLRDKVRRFIGDSVASTDASGWDWSVPSWLYMSAEARYQNSSPEFRCLTKNLLHICMNKTLIFSDGLIVCQEQPGIVPSGSYQTGSLNSFLRALLRFFIDEHIPVTMGDDCLEKHIEGLVDLYKELGFTIKYPGGPSTLEDFEFCSKQFRNGGVVPVQKSVEKMLLNAYLSKDPQVLDSISMELQEAEHYTHLFDHVLRKGQA